MHRFTGGDDVNMYTTTSITSPGRPTLSDSKALKLTDKPFALKIINKIDDIPGTQTSIKWNKFATKPQFNAAVDLPESVPRRPPQTRNVPDRQLMIEDIDGAQYSATGGMDRTTRQVDPLQPNYKLPSYVEPLALFDVPTLRAPRDVLKVDDIDGTRPSMFKRTAHRETRDPLNTKDIDGAQADYNGFKSLRGRFEVSLNKSRNFGGSASPVGMNQEDYQPITFPSPLKFADRTTRRSDPVQPIYDINGVTVQDDVRYTKPRRNPKFVEAGTYSLTTQDIPGATSTNSPYKKERREIRNIMNTADVQGAQADTIVHSIVTDRLTCPLFPVYKSLDDGSPVPHDVAPLVGKDRVKDPSIRLAKMRHEEMSKMTQAGNSAVMGAISPKITPHMTPQSNTPERSPINTSRSSNSAFFSPIRGSDDVRTDSIESSNSPFYSTTNVPRLSIQTGNSGPNTGRSGGARSGGRSGGRESARQMSIRDDIDAVRNLPN